MEIQYHGGNSVRVVTKKLQLVVDPVSDIASIKVDMKKVNIIASTQEPFGEIEASNDCFRIDSPGEYEFADISVKGVAVQPATASTGDRSGVMYRVSAQDTSALVIGHVNVRDAESVLEEVGVIDILIIPVGGGGYTLDAVDAANLTRAIEPKVVIPVHYNDGTDYEVKQDDIDLFAKELGVTISEEVVDRFKIKNLPEQLAIQAIAKS